MASWVSFAAIVAVLALVMSMLVLTPSQASAEEGDGPADSVTDTADESGEVSESPASLQRSETGPGETPETSDNEADPSTGDPAPVDGETATEGQAPTEAAELPTTLDVSPFAVIENRNEDIEVAVTGIIVEHETTDDAITVGDSVIVSGTWDATNADPQPGDQFSVDFPAELELDVGMPFELRGDDGTLWGECIINDDNSFTCTLTDEVQDRPFDVQGTWQLWSTATQYTTEEALNFDLNGRIEPVDLPGEGGIDDGFDLGEPAKTGEMRPDQQSVRWTIDIPGSALARLDGDGDGAVTLNDELSANMQLCEPDAAVVPTLRAGRDNLQPVSGGSVTIAEIGATGDILGLSIDIDAGADGFVSNQMYEIQYVTCATDGVDLDAEYFNTVEIEGEEYGGIGVSPDWNPQTEPSKWGTPLEAGRWGTHQWDVDVPGSWLNDNNAQSIEIADTLIGDHAVCEDGLNLRIYAQDQLPALGETGTPWTDVTGDFTVNETAVPDATEFDLVATLNGEAAFDSDQIYIFRYNSCVTSGEIPDGDAEFTNSADVNGTTVTARVEGRDFRSSKVGHINYELTEIAGEEFPAGTTIDWNVSIDGRVIEDSTEAYVLTDRFSDTLSVCEIEGVDLKESLNLSVTARDYIDRGQTEDLTEATDVELNENGELEFTLPMDEGHYSRDWIYEIDYTMCTASGGVDHRGETYQNAVAGEGVSESSHQTMNWGGGGTGQGVARGSFALAKNLHGDSETFNTDDYEFTVRVEEFAPDVDIADGNVDQDYTIQVKVDGTPVSGGFARGEGWQIRLSEIGFPEVPGLYFEPGQFQETAGVTVSEDGTQATLTITDPRNNAAVQLANTASLGGLELIKNVTGDAADRVPADELFNVTAYIDVDADGEYDRTATNAVVAGQTWNIPDLPIGAVVTFSEDQPDNSDQITWGNPVFEPSSLTVGADQSANRVTLTNQANTTEGTFSVQKNVVGDESGNSSVPESFEVTATWGEDESTPLTVPTNGEAVSYDGEIPAGTVVTLTEALPEDGDGIAWGTPVFSGAGVTVENGQAQFTIGLVPIAVTVQNTANDHVGDLHIQKIVEGEAAAAAEGANFEINAQIDRPEGEQDQNLTWTLQDGEVWELNDLPIGTEVTFSETLPADNDQVTWGEPTFEPSNTVVVGNDSEATLVTLTNTADVTEGTFSLHKELEGPERDDPNVPEIFMVTATWVDAEGIEQSRDIELPADGSIVEFGEDLVSGTQVTLTESVPADGNGIAWAAPSFSGEGVKIDEGGDAVVTIGLDPVAVTISNHVDVNDGTLRMIKRVGGEAAEGVAENTKFTVTATWREGTEFRSTELALRDGEAVGLGVDLPVGTEVTFTEGERPAVDGIEWGAITWSTNETNASWLRTNPDGTATGIVSDSSESGSLITLGNEAQWMPGSIGFEKLIDLDDETIAATEAGLPEGTEFQIQIDSVQVPEGQSLPEGAEISAGDVIILNAANDYRWTSDSVLPRGTVVAFTELEPQPVAGFDWGLPSYENTITVQADGAHQVEITNHAIPTTEVEIDKEVTGLKGGAVESHDSTRFQVTASWTDIDGFDRSCVLNVVPGQPAMPTTDCDATVIDGQVQFPVNTEITFTETGAHTDVSNVKWGEVIWSVEQGTAEVDGIEGEETAAAVTLTREPNDQVTLGLENKTTSNGLIIIPIPIPLPPFEGGSSFPPNPDPVTPVDPGEPGGEQPGEPGGQSPQDPDQPGEPGGVSPERPGEGTPGTPGDPASAQPVTDQAAGQGGPQESKGQGGLAETGANVAWLAGAALLLIIGGAWLSLRGRKNGA